MAKSKGQPVTVTVGYVSARAVYRFPSKNKAQAWIAAEFDISTRYVRQLFDAAPPGAAPDWYGRVDLTPGVHGASYAEVLCG